MKKFVLGESDLVINTLLAVGEKENRRVIDFKDVVIYKNELTKRALEREIEISYCDYDNNFAFIKECIYSLNLTKEMGVVFGIFPWVSIASLYDARENLPLELCAIMSDPEFSTAMVERDEKDRRSLNDVNDVVAQSYLKDLEKQQARIKQKIDDINRNRKI